MSLSMISRFVSIASLATNSQHKSRFIPSDKQIFYSLFYPGLKKNEPKKGKKVKATVTVTYQNQTLQAGRDYKLSYSNNKKVSKKAVVKIQGIGMYSGTLQKKFTIYPPKANLLVTKKSIKVKNWEKDKGFTILYKYKVDKGKYCKKPVNGYGLAKALKKHKGHKITIKAALKCNGITGAYSQGKKLKWK